MGKLNQFRVPVILLLIAVIIIGSAVVWSRYNKPQPIEISLPPVQESEYDGFIGGAVNNPGFYSLNSSDSIADFIAAAGGVTAGADFSQLKIYIPAAGEAVTPQKIDLNRAEAWLLEALPGIGETRALAIINYRQQNGLFYHISEITNIEGIGISTYEQIKDLITVAE